MMNSMEEAIIYATVMHQGKVRKFEGRPFIFHPLWYGLRRAYGTGQAGTS